MSTNELVRIRCDACRLCELRRQKQESELALKQEVTAISQLKAFLQARNEEDERVRLDIGEIERAIEKYAERYAGPIRAQLSGPRRMS